MNIAISFERDDDYFFKMCCAELISYLGNITSFKLLPNGTA